jgi:hypothetical protein
LKKVTTIADYNTSIIFLSDLRLNNNPNINDITNGFLYNNSGRYEFIFHSTLNRRGVGILINKSLNYSILDTYRDDQENILGIKCTISGCELWLISIYGPNTNDRSFFNSLGGLIDRCGGVPVVVGGGLEYHGFYP